MPIRGLTDQGARLPQLGTLRKGGKKEKKTGKDGKTIETYGKDLNEHFRFESENADVAAAFAQEFGVSPTEIKNIYIPFDTVDEAFEAWQEEYVASGLKHRCDGKTCVLHLKKDGTYSDEPIPCPGGCKASGRLKILIPQLGRRGVVTVLTTSKHDIINIHGNLLDLQMAAGTLKGIPLVLSRVAKKISTPAGDGKRARREKWLVSIQPKQQWVNLLTEAQEQRALSGLRGLLNAAPTDVLMPEDDEDDEEEERNPLRDAADEKMIIFESLLNVWVAMGKTREEWPAYRAKHLDKKSIAELKRDLHAWEKKASEILEGEIQDGQVDAAPTKDELLSAIDRIIAGLRAENVQGHEVTKQILTLTSGQDLLDCDEEILTNVLAYLEKWSEREKVPLAKTA
jgi:hypothetical protein